MLASLLGFGVNAVFSAAGQWVASGATWILQQVVGVVSATTAAPIGTAWFVARLHVVEAIGATLAVPFACMAAVQAVLRQSPGLLVRAVVVHLPVSLLCAGTAAALVQMGLAVTDVLARQMLTGAGTSAGGALAPVSAAFGAAAGAPSFALLLAAVVVAVAGLTLWLEMAVRAAAVSLAVLFLPLVMAAMVWPAVAHWCRRLAETLAALVLSKLVVVGAIGLATAALANGVAGGPVGGSFGAVVTGAALLVVAASCPFALMRLIPAVEAGAMAQLEQGRHHLKQAAGAPMRMARLAGMGGGAADPGPVGPIDTDDGLGDAGAGRGPSGGGGGPGGGAGGAANGAGGGAGGVVPGGAAAGGPGSGAAGAMAAAGAASGGIALAGIAAAAGGPSNGAGAAGAGAPIGTRPTAEQLACYGEAAIAGVHDRDLDAAVERRLGGMSPDEAYAPFLGPGLVSTGPGSGSAGPGPAPGTTAGPDGRGGGDRGGRR